MSEPTPYTLSGTVQAGNGVYIPRRADDALLQLCRSGTFSYVLTPRQMGKSSLMVKCATTLEREGIRPVIVDLTAIGVQVTAESWYLGVLDIIGDRLGLNTDVIRWWKEQGDRGLGVVQRFTMFFEKVLLEEVKGDVVVFVDEIDTTLSLGFTDDFYAAIRYFYTSRAHNTAFHRLSFVLIGVATPSDLIRDPQRTPFNIGQRVDLTDFTVAEADPLRRALCTDEQATHRVLKRIFDWTAGHPYLTQRLCIAVADRQKVSLTDSEVDTIVEQTFFGDDSEFDKDLQDNLQFVRDMLTKRAPSPAVLEVYADVRKGKRVEDDEQSLIKSHLKLSGVVRIGPGRRLRVSNPIYSRVFNPTWIRQHLPVNWTRRLQRAAFAAMITLLCLNVPVTIYAFWKRGEAENQALRASTEATAARRAEFQASRSAREASMSATAASRNALIADAFRKKADEETAKAKALQIEAERQTVLYQKQAAELVALRLERDATEAALKGDYVAAQRMIAERLALAEKEPGAVTDDPVQRARFIAYRQSAAQQIVPLWTALEKGTGAIAFDRTRKRIAAPLVKGVIGIYDADSGATLNELAAPGSLPEGTLIAFHETDDGLAVIAAGDKGIYRWPSALQKTAPRHLELPAAPGDHETGTTAAGAASPREAPGGEAAPKDARPARKFLAFSPDGRLLAGVDGGRLTIWNLEGDKATALAVPVAFDEQANLKAGDVAFNPSGSRIAFYLDDRLLEVDTRDGRLLFTVAREEHEPHRFRYQSDSKLQYLTSAGVFPSLDEARGDVLAEPLSVSDDWRYMALTNEGTLLLRDLAQNRQISPRDQSPVCRNVAFGSSQHLACVAEDGTIAVWTPAGRDYAAMFAESVAIGNRGTVVTSTERGDVRSSDGASWHVGADVDELLLSADERFLVVIRRENFLSGGHAEIWDRTTHSKIVSLTANGFFTPRLTGDGKGLVYGWNADRTLRVLDFADVAKGRYRGHRHQAMDVALNPDQSRVVVTHVSAGVTAVHDFENDSMLLSLQNQHGPVLGAVFSPVEKRILTRHFDGKIAIWDARTGKTLSVLDAHDGPVGAAAYAPSGALVASSGGPDGAIKLWDLRTGTVRLLTGHTGGVTAIRFRGDRVASTSQDGTLRFWSVADGRDVTPSALARAQRTPVPLLSFDWSADGTRIAMGARDGTVRVIDATTGQEIASKKVEEAVHHVVFGRDAATVFIGDEAGFVSRFEVANGSAPPVRLHSGSDAVHGMAYSRSTDEIVFGTAAGTYSVIAATDGSERTGTSGVDFSAPSVMDARLAADGRPVVAERDGTRGIAVREAGSSRILRSVPKAAGGILSSNARWFVFMDDGLRVVPVGDGANEAHFPGGRGPVAFSSDDKLFAYTTTARANFGGPEETGDLVHVFDLAAQRELAVLPALSVERIVLSPASNRIAVREASGVMKLWNFDVARDLYREAGTSLLKQVRADLSSREMHRDETVREVSEEQLSVDEMLALDEPESENRYQMPEPTAPDGELAALHQQLQREPNNVALKYRIGAEAQRYRHLVRTQKAHPAAVVSLTVSGDGDRIASAGLDGVASVWNATSGALIRSVHHGAAASYGTAITSVDLNAAGSRLLTASRDGSARVWNVSSGDIVLDLDAHLSAVRGATFSSDDQSILTWGIDGTARVFNASNGATVDVLRTDQRLISAAFSPDGRRIATGGGEGEVRLWSPGTAGSVELSGHKERINALAFSPDGSFVASASADDTVRVWSVADGRMRRLLEHPEAVARLQFSADGGTLMTVADETVRVWDGASGSLLQELRHDDFVATADFAGNGALIITTSTDRTIVWDVKSGRTVAEFDLEPGNSSWSLFGENSPVITVASLMPAGNRIVTGNRLGRLDIWDLSHRDAFFEEGIVVADGFPPGSTTPVWQASSWGTIIEIRYSKDGSKLLLGGARRTVVVSTRNGALLHELEIPPQAVIDADWSPDQKSIVVASEDGYAKVFGLEQAPAVERFTLQHEDRVRVARYSPNGTRIVTASRDGTAKLWTASGQLVQSMKHETYVRMAEFSADGRYLATSDHTPRLWDANDGKLLKTFGSRNNVVNALSFSRDGERLLVAGSTGTAEVWETRSGKLLFSSPNLGFIYDAHFTPDGQQVVIGASNGSVSIWNVDSRTKAADLEGQRWWLTSLAISSDGQWIASVGSTGTAIISDRASGKTIARLRGAEQRAGYGAFSPDGTAYFLATGAEGGASWRLPFLVGADGTRAHGAEIRRAVLSGDARVAATLDAGGGVRTWDGKTWEPLTAIATEAEAVAFNPRSELLTVTRTANAGWQLVNHHTGATAPIRPDMPVEPISASHLARDGKRIALGRRDGSVEIHEVATSRMVRKLSVSTMPVMWLWINADGTRVAARDTNRHITLWDVAAGTKLLDVAENGGRKWALSGDERQMLMAIDGFNPTIVDVMTGKITRELAGAMQTTRALGWSQSSDRVVSVGTRGAAYIWSATTGKLIRTFSDERVHILYAALSPDGKRIAVGGARRIEGDDARLCLIYDVESGAELADLSTPDDDYGWIWSIAFSGDGRRLAVLYSGSKRTDPSIVRVWDAETNTILLTAPKDDHGGDVAFTPDSRALLSINPNRGVDMWDLETGNEYEFNRNAGALSFQISEDGRVLAVEADEQAHVWEVATGRQLALFAHAAVVAAAPADDTVRVVYSGSDGSLAVHDVHTGKGRTLAWPGGPPRAAAVSADGKRLTAADSRGKVVIWELESGEQVSTFEHDGEIVPAIGFGPRPDRIFAIDADGSVEYRSDAGHALASFETLGSTTVHVAAVDGRREFIAFATDNHVRLYSIATKEPVAMWRPRTKVTMLEFLPDGTLLGGGRDGSLMQWNLGALEVSDSEVRRAIELVKSMR